MEIIRIFSLQGHFLSGIKFSEANYDFLKFSVDGTVQGSWSGTVDWTPPVFYSGRSAYFKWAYTKDDLKVVVLIAWIDDIISLFNIYLPITYSPLFAQSLNPDQTATKIDYRKTGLEPKLTVSRPSGPLPFWMSFENGGSIPSGWTQQNVNGFVPGLTTGG